VKESKFYQRKKPVEKVEKEREHILHKTVLVKRLERMVGRLKPPYNPKPQKVIV
jgi:hypothetical protein